MWFKLEMVLVGVVAGVGLAACGSPEAKFRDACVPGAVEEGLSDVAARTACTCAYERLEASLTRAEMNAAVDYMASGESAGVEEVAEAVDGAIKSCAM